MLCFGKFLVAKNIGEKKKDGGVMKISVETFCLEVPKNFVRESFNLSLISGIEKNYASECYVKIFRRIFFVSQYRNNL